MRNWTIKEAVNVIVAGTDEEAINELAKHFPMFFMAVVKNDIVSLANAMGEKFTVRRLEFGAAAAEDGGDDTAEDTAETEDAGDLSVMSTKQLMKLCDKRGIKVPHYGKNKQFYLDALTNGAAAKPTTGKGETEIAEDGEGGNDPYAGKSAMELYKECKKRGIKAEAKKPAKHYAKLLADDDANATESEAGDDDGWDDEPAEEPKPTTKDKKAAGAKSGGKKSGGKKNAKSEPTEDDDGDDWEI